MTAIYVLAFLVIYFMIGLIVAKCVQKRLSKDPVPLSIDSFLMCGGIWPITLVGLVAVTLKDIVVWFYNLGKKK